MYEFLFGAGLALLITLLAWSDQIISLHRDTLEAEKLMSDKRKVDWKVIKNLLKENTDPKKILIELNKIFNKSSSKNFEDIKIIYHFRSLDRQSRHLKTLYHIKYNLIIFLAFAFFIGGICTFFINEETTFSLFCYVIFQQSLPSIICILLSILILIYIVILNLNEKRYRNNFTDLIDQI